MSNNTISSVLASLAILFTLSSTAQAQSVFDSCLSQLAANDLVSAKASAKMIKRMRGTSGDNIPKAEDCLSGAFGETYLFDLDTGKIVTEAEVISQDNLKAEAAARKASASAREQRLQDSIQAAEILTVRTCFSLYRKDTEAAILNPVCNRLFMQIGLPDD